MNDLSELAQAVSAVVEQASSEKTAAESAIPVAVMQTPVGQMLQKIATQLRLAGFDQITYTDLDSFRKAHDL